MLNRKRQRLHFAHGLTDRPDDQAHDCYSYSRMIDEHDTRIWRVLDIMLLKLDLTRRLSGDRGQVLGEDLALLRLAGMIVGLEQQGMPGADARRWNQGKLIQSQVEYACKNADYWKNS